MPGGVEGVMGELEAFKKFQGSKTIGGSSGPTLDLPRRLWQNMVSAVPIAPELKWCDVKKDDLRKLATLVVNCDLHVSGKNTNKDEFVTAGGVTRPTIDFRTMESRVVPGIFFVGECIDIDGITGGFNFQAAWTTAHIAAKALAVR
jgi:predicted flavoprotein YhiN